MILFLLLSYIALLMILLKLKIIRLTLGWKISPMIFIAICFFVLIFPMQWGAPSGTVNVYRYVIEVVPNVSGQVVQVAAKPLEPMKKGAVLFQIDPRPYQGEVTQLEAALKQARQAALMLESDLVSAQASVAQSEATHAESKQKAEALEAKLDSAQASLKKAEAQVALTQANLVRTKDLFAKGVATKAKLDAEQENWDSATATLNEEKADLEQAQLALHSQIDGVNTIVLHAQQGLRGALAVEAKAQLALESTVDGENTAVAQLVAQLELAKLNLDWTTVRAPADGYVMQLALRPGQRVMNSPIRSWLAFVEQEETRIVVWIQQYQLRHVQSGQPVEVEFKLYPGQTFSAKVDEVISMNAMGQLQATGKLLDTTATPIVQQEYAVILSLDEDSPIDVASLPGGAIGKAAIYTNHSKMTHFIRRVEMRMHSWMNYFIP